MKKSFKCALIGAPGSGKGTLAMKIMEKYDIFHICTGDIFRRHIAEQTDLGKTVQKYLMQGKFVPDILVNRVVSEKLKEIKDANVLFDGFPRNRTQGEKLFMTFPLNLAIYLKVPVQIIIDRVSGRWVHPPSGRIYNTVYQPPKKPGLDDVTGEPLVQRPDDERETLKARLKLFEESTVPLLEFLKKEGVLKEFAATTSKEMWLKVDTTLMTFMRPKS